MRLQRLQVITALVLLLLPAPASLVAAAPAAGPAGHGGILASLLNGNSTVTVQNSEEMRLLRDIAMYALAAVVALTAIAFAFFRISRR